MTGSFSLPADGRVGVDEVDSLLSAGAEAMFAVAVALLAPLAWGEPVAEEPLAAVCDACVVTPLLE